MAEEKKDAPAPAASAGSSGKGLGKLAPILIIVNTVLTVGMLVVLFISFTREKNKTTLDDINPHAEEELAEAGHDGEGKPAAPKKKKTEFGKMISLDQFTVNLTTPGSAMPKFVRVNISLEVATDDTEAEVTSKMPQVRNVIIDLFNSKRPGDLATAEGREYLKEEIRNAINGFVVTGKVKGVFFTNFAFSS